MAVPVRADLIGQLDTLARRTLASWARAQDHRRTELRAAIRALPSADELLGAPRQRLDGAADRLPRALIANAQVHHTAFSRIAGRLTPQTLTARIGRERERAAALAARAGRCMQVQRERRRERFIAASVRLAASLRANAQAHEVRIARARERVDTLMTRAGRAVLATLDRRQARLDRAGQLLDALSYHGVLARGFALVRGEAGRPLRSAAASAPAPGSTSNSPTAALQRLRAARRMDAVRSSEPAPKTRARRLDIPGQGTLF